MNEQWFIINDNKKEGPYSLHDLKEFIKSGKLKKEDFLADEKDNSYKATQIQGLFHQDNKKTRNPPIVILGVLAFSLILGGVFLLTTNKENNEILLNQNIPSYENIDEKSSDNEAQEKDIFDISSIEKGRGNTAGNLINSGLATQCEDWIYYYCTDERGVCRKKIAGTEREIINNEIISFLNVVDDWLFYVCGRRENSIHRIHINGDYKKRLNYDESVNLIVHDEWMYYLNRNDNYSIYKMKLDGSERQKINDDPSSYLNVTDDWIYYANQQDRYAIYRIRKDGSDRQKINEDVSLFFVVDEDWIYYRKGQAGGTLFRMKTDGTQKEQLNHDVTEFINVYNGWVYYSNWDDDSSIYRIRLDGSDRQKINQQPATFNNIAGDYLFFINPLDQTLQIIKKDGSET